MIVWQMNMQKGQMKKFRAAIWKYYKAYGRHNLPWRKTKNPYHILVSEIMLQQTQVSRVLIKYSPFLKEFPSLPALAASPLQKVLNAWHGLGYNRRALMLKRCAEETLIRYKGTLPKDTALLKTLPGIGPSTAGAVAAFAYNLPHPFIETNIRRVFLHFFFLKKTLVADKEILPLVIKTVDQRNPCEWFWALMDYGAMLGMRRENANRRSNTYKQQPPFRGSQRELRGKILHLLLTKGLTPQTIAGKIGASLQKTLQATFTMEREGLVTKRRKKVFISP